MSLSSLPSELYCAIISHLDDQVVQSTVLTLTRTIPDAPIPLKRLFERIRIRTPKSAVQLYQRLRGGKTEAHHVRELSIETWSADAQVIINLLALLDDLTNLALFVGPNFAPENLLEVFERPRERLEVLSLRFRPYVQRANYYHFLKGAYFDPAISAIASWPSSSLRSLSIVQDPLVDQGPFAQPLVFFGLKEFLPLSISTAAQGITILRIRIPARDVGPHLAVSPNAFPSLRTLDLSTGNIKGQQLTRLLARFDRVEHVKLDGCAMLAGREPSEWGALGMDCALIGEKRARDRERALKAWREMHTQLTLDQAQQPQRRIRAGRKGLATATISIRSASDPVLPASNPYGGTESDAVPPPPIDPAVLQHKVRIAPLPPSLLTITATAPPPIPGIDASMDLSEHFGTFREEFAEGWKAGINRLRASWSRLRTSAKNNVHIYALGPGAAPETQGLGGLEELDEQRWKDLEEGQYPVPDLCLAGESYDGTYCCLHSDKCGHRLTESAWGDDSFLR
ncbi:uncharacterized protein FOMMEDRAFT_128866 [Fomitiporia mediterranea MF3/22]|uniref:uncharacterized protein n=1 Tax=Fomitiporia mediterranea (strain MF3/22) TaxID=694068 RepID=UPI0004409034|nr:uncharacterized protein FOMMEDRAFT_128866 [Fomitiporia mediterranea MF3/22]EJC98594.1 hypothetical protein FOMMEDRAFT_128866 [Fomitiporia mediterranea MF3/22]